MSLLPGFIRARMRQDDQDDSAPQTEAAADLHIDDSYARDSHIGDSYDAELDENVFNLLPPESAEPVAPEPIPEPAIPEPKPQGRNRHPVDMTDLSRLSIDRDGRLYWDGKPVETHHRLSMSRQQIVGASLVAALIAIGAIGAAVQGAAAARDWACRLGWSASACALPGRSPQNRPDIPA
jgi:hypothetical protein